MKYYVTSEIKYSLVHLIEANSEEEAIKISKEADDNWQSHAEQTLVSIEELTDENYRQLVEKSDGYLFKGYIYRSREGYLGYTRFAEEEK